MWQWLEIRRRGRKQVEAQEALVSEGLDKVAERRAGITAFPTRGERGVDAAPCGETLQTAQRQPNNRLQ